LNPFSLAGGESGKSSQELKFDAVYSLHRLILIRPINSVSRPPKATNGKVFKKGRPAKIINNSFSGFAGIYLDC